MKSYIEIFKCAISPERNSWIEDCEAFLHDSKYSSRTYEANDFQYLKIKPNISITITADQEKVGNSIGNYVRIYQDNRNYFYFIVSATWTSPSAITLELSLDTINTFGKDLEFSDKTTIQREHEDRFLWFGQTDENNNKILFRKIDKIPENLNASKKLVNNLDIIDNQGNFDWYLIYKTRDDLSKENISNPIACYLVASEQLLYEKAGDTKPQVVVKPNTFIQDKFYYGSTRDNIGLHFTLPNGINRVINDNEVLMVQRDIRNGLSAYILHYENGAYKSKELLSHTLSEIRFLQCNLLRQSSIELFDMESMTNSQLTLPIGAGQVENILIKSIKEIDKTDSRLMKIIKLPYCPVEVRLNFEGEYQFPNEWVFDHGLMRLKDYDLSKEFLNNITDLDLTNDLIVKTKPATSDIKDIRNESKLYNSEFYNLKYTYDSFSKDLALENFSFGRPASSNISVKVPLDFKQSNTINSKFAFRFNTSGGRLYKYDKHSDFEDYLIVSRNNELPIFSNDYVNYIRNGINYDQKAKAMSLVQGVLGIGLGGLEAGITYKSGVKSEKPTLTKEEKRHNLQMAARAGKPVTPHVPYEVSPFLTAGALRAGFGAAQSAISLINSQVSQADAIKRKQQELASQGTNVAGSDDVDLLSYYNNNRLQLKKYDLEDLQKQNIFNLFYYGGYNHPIQAIPNLNSRYWFNYIQCDPVFKNEETAVYNEYLEDIKIRFNNGVTVFHHKDTWDFDQELENWEVNLLN